MDGAMNSVSLGETAIRIGAALLCGALVGLERERKNRPAGFRTMILVSLGSCGFVLVGLESIAYFAQLQAAQGATGTPVGFVPGQAEISRVLQGLIGGIGFLGAGAVIQSKRAVRGITTAAAVWVVAALGAACGMGFYPLAIMLAIATLFTLIVLEFVENRYFPDPNDGAFEPKDKKRKDRAQNGNGYDHDDHHDAESSEAHNGHEHSRLD